MLRKYLGLERKVNLARNYNLKEDYHELFEKQLFGMLECLDDMWKYVQEENFEV